MTFSDDDLKRLKASIPDDPKYANFHPDNLKLVALLSRLEAAEKLINNRDGHKEWKLFQAWRKAAGK